MRLARAEQKLGYQFKSWWIYLWGVIAVALLTVIWFVPFIWWALAALVGFGTLESIGIFVSGPDGPYPPLTDVIRCYIPIWGSVPVMWAICAGAGSSWFHWKHPLPTSLLAGLAGWLTVHFTDAYYKVDKL